MKYTNRYNFPAHICKWIEADSYDYDPNVISATTLISPARAWALKRRHAEELTIDYADMIALRYGTAIHDSLEKTGALNSDTIIEQRYYTTYAGFVISGKPDAVIGGILRDNKSTSVFKYIKKEFDDYVKQLSIYRWILHRNLIRVSQTAKIDFFFTDWKRSDAAKGGGYPPARYHEQDIELMSLDATAAYVAERLEEFAFAESLLPECSGDELWRPPTTFAVYRLNKDKTRQARAFRVFATKTEADQTAAEIGGEVEERTGKAKRCAYCTAAPFCEQYNELKAAGLTDEQ